MPEDTPPLQGDLRCSAAKARKTCVSIIIAYSPREVFKLDATIISKSSERERKPHQKHLDHIIKGRASEFRHGLVHRLVSIKESMKFPEAKAGVDKECDKLKNLLAKYLEKVKPKAQVVRQARKCQMSSLLAFLMDLCHLKHAELQSTSGSTKEESCSGGTSSKTTTESSVH